MCKVRDCMNHLSPFFSWSFFLIPNVVVFQSCNVVTGEEKAE